MKKTFSALMALLPLFCAALMPLFIWSVDQGWAILIVLGLMALLSIGLTVGYLCTARGKTPRAFAIDSLFFSISLLVFLAAKIVLWLLLVPQHAFYLLVLLLVYLPHGACCLFLRACGIFAIHRAQEGGNLRLLHVLLHLIPLLDVVSSVIVLRKKPK